MIWNPNREELTAIMTIKPNSNQSVKTIFPCFVGGHCAGLSLGREQLPGNQLKPTEDTAPETNQVQTDSIITDITDSFSFLLTNF